MPRPITPAAHAATARTWADELLDLAREIGGSPLAQRLAPLPPQSRIAEIRRAAGVDASPRVAVVDACCTVLSLNRA